MKLQKLVQVPLINMNSSIDSAELSLQNYLNEGWVIVSYKICPRTDNCAGDVVVLLEKEK